MSDTTQKNIIEPQQNSGYIKCIQVNFEDIFTDESSKLKAKNKNKTCCCIETIIGQKILLLTLGAINFILVIISLITLIKKNKYYLLFRTEVIVQQTDFSSQIVAAFYGVSLNDINSKLPTFTNFWCNIGKAEDGVLISYLILLILYLGFEIFTLLIHNNLIRLKIEGLLYYIIVGLYSFFLIIFYLYISLIAYLFFYSLIVITVSPLNVDYDYERAPTEFSSYFIIMDFNFNSIGYKK